MRVLTILPALLGTMLLFGAASPASADRDGWGRRDPGPPGWQNRGSHDRGWHDRGWRERAWREQAWREQIWRERAWREHLFRQREALRFSNPPIGVPPGYPYRTW